MYIKRKRFTALLLAGIMLATVGCSSAKESADTAVINSAVTEAKTLSTADSGYNSIFDGDKVIDIKVTLPEEDYQDMLDNASEEEYHSADITVDGKTVTNVGFRTKGNLTLRSVVSSDSDRYSFRVKFDKYVDDQTLLGLDELVLNNMYSDASYMREYLSYEALRSLGTDTPQCVFANIYINGELKGLYLCVEAIDDSYLERVYGSNNCNLYKAEQGSTLVYKENDDYESLELKNGDDEDKTGLKNLISVLNSMPDGEKGDIESVLNVDTALKYIAFNYVFANSDSYIGNLQQNYYLCQTEDGKFSVIPWDYNMAFGGQGGGGGGTLDSPAQSRGNTDTFPLVTKLLAVDEYKQQYHGYVQQLLSYMSTLENRISEVKELITDDVEADPTKFCTTEEFNKATAYSEDEQTEEGLDFGGMPRNENEYKQTKDNDGQSRRGGKGGFDNMQPPTDGNFGGMQPPTDGNFGGMQPPTDGNFGGMQPPTDGQMPNDGGHGHGGGMGMQNNTSSIVNFTRTRIEKITGELNGNIEPTTETSTGITGTITGVIAL